MIEVIVLTCLLRVLFELCATESILKVIVYCGPISILPGTVDAGSVPYSRLRRLLAAHSILTPFSPGCSANGCLQLSTGPGLGPLVLAKDHFINH